MISVMLDLTGLPVPFVKICGTSKSCKPPISDVMITYISIGLRSGSVILKNTCVLVAPSTSAASNSDVSIPSIPAISRMVVLPNHIRQFINAMSPLVLPTCDRNLYGSEMKPICISRLFIGPPSANNVKNNSENAEAIIRFGRYITVLKNLVPLSFKLTSENHAPRSSDKNICGMKHMIQRTIVFLKYCQISPDVNNFS